MDEKKDFSRPQKLTKPIVLRQPSILFMRHALAPRLAAAGII